MAIAGVTPFIGDGAETGCHCRLRDIICDDCRISDPATDFVLPGGAIALVEQNALALTSIVSVKSEQ